MSNNEITDMCRKIYKEHKQALDLIYNHKPDDRLEIKNRIVNLLKSEKYTSLGIKHDNSNKAQSIIAVKKWDDYPIQKSGEGQWTESNRVLMFVISNSQSGIELMFYIGPGNDDFREHIYKCIKENATIFNVKSNKLSAKWNQTFKKQLLSKKYLEKGLEDVFDELDKKLYSFFTSNKFSKIIKVIHTALDNYLKSNEEL